MSVGKGGRMSLPALFPLLTCTQQSVSHCLKYLLLASSSRVGEHTIDLSDNKLLSTVPSPPLPLPKLVVRT